MDTMNPSFLLSSDDVNARVYARPAEACSLAEFVLSEDLRSLTRKIIAHEPVEDDIFGKLVRVIRYLCKHTSHEFYNDVEMRYFERRYDDDSLDRFVETRGEYGFRNIIASCIVNDHVPSYYVDDVLNFITALMDENKDIRDQVLAMYGGSSRATPSLCSDSSVAPTPQRYVMDEYGQLLIV